MEFRVAKGKFVETSGGKKHLCVLFWIKILLLLLLLQILLLLLLLQLLLQLLQITLQCCLAPCVVAGTLELPLLPC